MACQILTFEEVLQWNPYTANQYALIEALGFASLACCIFGISGWFFTTANFLYECKKQRPDAFASGL